MNNSKTSPGEVTAARPGLVCRIFRQLLRWTARLLIATAILVVLAVAAFVIAVHVRRGEFRPKHRQFIRFALCQYDARKGDVRWSFLHALDYADEAVRHGADVIVLPEFSFTTVYDVRDRLALFNIMERPEYAGRLADFTRRNGCYLFFNHPYVTNDVPRHPRKSRYNTSYVMGPDGGIVTNYVKQSLALLDQRCHFTKGGRDVIAELPFGTIGMMICKDSAFPEHFQLFRDTDLVVIQFAHITHWANTEAPTGLDEVTASAFGKMARISQHCARVLNKPLLMVNKSGLEDEFAYVGDSRVVIANGTCLAEAGSDCRILYADFPLGPDGRIDRDHHPVVPENPVDFALHDKHARLWKLRRSLLRLEPRVP